MLTGVTLGLAAVTLLLLAVAMSWVLGWANRAFHVEVDPRVAAIDAVLPGANCGGCGFIGCGEYAEGVARGEAAVDVCGPGGTSCWKAVADVMGVEVDQTWPLRAVVHCAANASQRLQRIDYRGEQTCAAANLVSGVQGCVYGCLGLGDCVAACDYDAIHSRDGLAVVDYDACIGCKACSLVCPRNIISMVPFKTQRMLVVACSNQDMGKDVKDVCQVGCIGCTKCTKGPESITMVGKLPVIDYAAYDAALDPDALEENCPMESLFAVGRPVVITGEGPEEGDLERVTADFKTTVDKTEWWG